MTNDKVVYLHSTTDGLPFYVGMGSEKRARAITMSSRSAQWCEFVQTNGGLENVIVTLLETGLTQEEADERETFYISKFRKSNPETMVNVQDGGPNQGKSIRLIFNNTHF